MVFATCLDSPQELVHLLSEAFHYDNTRIANLREQEDDTRTSADGIMRESEVAAAHLRKAPQAQLNRELVYIPPLRLSKEVMRPAQRQLCLYRSLCFWRLATSCLSQM